MPKNEVVKLDSEWLDNQLKKRARLRAEKAALKRELEKMLASKIRAIHKLDVRVHNAAWGSVETYTWMAICPDCFSVSWKEKADGSRHSVVSSSGEYCKCQYDGGFGKEATGPGE